MRYLPLILFFGLTAYIVYLVLLKIFGIHGFSKSLINKIVMVESGGNPRAVGSAGEIGLMQIKAVALADYNRVYGASFGLNDLFSPDINIEVGAGYLAWLKDNWSLTTRQALVAYNAGIGNYLNKTQPFYSNGQLYANKILR